MVKLRKGKKPKIISFISPKLATSMRSGEEKTEGLRAPQRQGPFFQDLEMHLKKKICTEGIFRNYLRAFKKKIVWVRGLASISPSLEAAGCALRLPRDTHSEVALFHSSVSHGGVLLRTRFCDGF